MSIISIKNPNVTVKKLRLNSLQNIKECCDSAFAYGDKIYCGYKPIKEDIHFEETTKLYKIDKGFIAFKKDGKFVKILGDNVQEIKGLLLDTPPLITYVTYNGHRRLIAIIKDKCLFLDGNREYLNIFKGKDYIQVGLNLFATYNNGIVFAPINDFFNNQKEDSVSYVGLVEGGKTIKLVESTEGVIAFTERVIYSLSFFNSQSSLNLSKVYTHTCKILKNTVVSVGDRVFFLDEMGDIFCLSEDNVTFLLHIGKQSISAKGGYAHFGNLIYDFAEYFIYVNVDSKTFYKIKTKGKQFVNGDYLFDGDDGYLYTLKKEMGSVETKCMFVKKNARLERIKFNTSALTTIKISGGFGSKKIFVGKGLIDVKLNLYSDSFRFCFQLQEDGEIDEIEIEYS